ncbi:hypothetical protein V6N12_074097 [Hibiscus sabdariffa]|uniref:Uncharacterized protein n=1 Tax=Hibiscus sabdariffa TaxID=183260 RepID=A0ABR2BFT7_9ROSI
MTRGIVQERLVMTQKQLRSFLNSLSGGIIRTRGGRFTCPGGSRLSDSNIQLFISFLEPSGSGSSVATAGIRNVYNLS